jgi:hypothetical protein
VGAQHDTGIPIEAHHSIVPYREDNVRQV